MPEILKFDEFKVKHAKTCGKWKVWPVQNYNIPVLIEWCKINCKNDFCIKIASWGRNRSMESPNATANHTVVFANKKDASAALKQVGRFWEPIKVKDFNGVIADESFVWVE